MLCASTLLIHASPRYDIFLDGLGADWQDWSWPNYFTTNYTTTFKGSAALQETFPSPWTGVRFYANGGFNTTGYQYLNLAVYNKQTAGSLFIYAMNMNGQMIMAKNLSDYSDSFTFPQGMWKWVRVPLYDLGCVDITINSIVIECGGANATVLFDEVSFSSGATIYEGISADYGSAVEEGPGIMVWYWNTSWWHENSGEDYWLNVSPTAVWGGVQLQSRWAFIGTSSALSVLFKKTSAAQTLYVGLTRTDGSAVGNIVQINDSYLPSTLRPMQANKWYRITIPITDFLSQSTPLGVVYLQSSTANTFYIDDTKFIPVLSWPITGVAKQVTGYHFGDHWENGYCSSFRKLHTGNDYTDNADQGRAVYSCMRGVVKQKYDQPGGWGYVVVVQHESGLTTSYLHLNEPTTIQEGQEVWPGTLLGTTKYLSGGSHLHFGLRVKDYDVNSQNGALPESACDGLPAFPSSFLDTENLSWFGQ